MIYADIRVVGPSEHAAQGGATSRRSFSLFPACVGVGKTDDRNPGICTPRGEPPSISDQGASSPQNGADDAIYSMDRSIALSCPSDLATLPFSKNWQTKMFQLLYLQRAKNGS